uniref:Uncharacterized protein n=1 Tax=Oryza meridionalis TaxID=40149 RepID=A0A0E0DFB0_9ORYZ
MVGIGLDKRYLVVISPSIIAAIYRNSIQKRYDTGDTYEVSDDTYQITCDSYHVVGDACDVLIPSRYRVIPVRYHTILTTWWVMLAMYQVLIPSRYRVSCDSYNVEDDTYLVSCDSYNIEDDTYQQMNRMKARTRRGIDSQRRRRQPERACDGIGALAEGAPAGHTDGAGGGC